MEFIKITTMLPPYGKRVIFRATSTWRNKETYHYFDDELTGEEETLDYGLTGYLLKDNSDFLVSQHQNINEICNDFVTHWCEIPESFS